MTIDHIHALVSSDFAAVNALILEKIQSQAGIAQDLSHHLLNSGGKRLRPLLVLLAAKACGYAAQDHITLAAMIELFHTATLLHDDVVDESTLRRGKQTANTIWGSKASVLVGDFLYTQSVQLLVQVDHSKILKLLANTSLEISCGELKQLANQNNPSLTFDDYFEVIRAKTSLLFAACTCIGAILTESSDEFENNLYAFGLHLGNAFQIIDDALDYCADAQTIGKNIGDDLANGKVTLPLIYALAQGTGEQQECIRQAILQGSLEFLPQIINTLKSTGAMEHTKKIAAQEVDRALSALHVLADSPYKQALIQLAHFAMERTN